MTCRVAALMVVERSRSTFVDEVASWYDKLAATSALRRVTRNVSSSTMNQVVDVSIVQCFLLCKPSLLLLTLASLHSRDTVSV